MIGENNYTYISVGNRMVKLEDRRFKTVRHWSELKKNFFYLKTGERSNAEIWQVVDIRSTIKARRHSLKGEIKKWANRKEITEIPLCDLQTLGILPDPLGDFTKNYCVVPLNTTKLEVAIAKASLLCKEIEEI